MRAAEDGALEIARLSDNAAVGVVELEPRPDGVFVRRLEVAPEHRGYGAGSEAANLLREAAAAGGARVLRAWAAPNLGLSVYFWSRMGLRPLFGDGPNGGIAFERRLQG
ncbi:hypothetical protein AYO38_04730 [bacterium SCGC AG-212-C10]|nr:hypothetical protein AYO38_04730 [bacterium SCGC AG-212-C10]